MNNSEIKKLIKEKSALFWWIREDKKKDISIKLLVETILNYGNIKDIKKLFKLVGIKKVAKIFFGDISRQRVNYYPQVANFFKLYFKKHA